MSFAVKTSVFEGPLDLLLSLIEKRTLLINDISLAAVADDYLAYLKNLSEFPSKDVAHFLLVASTLVLIKSRSLLPEFALTSDEEADVRDLEMRLTLYKEAQRLSKHLQKALTGNALHAPLKSPVEREIVFAPHKTITTNALLESVRGIIAALPKPETLKRAVVETVMSLEEMMGRLSERITNALKMRFSDFAKSHHEGKHTPQEKKVNTIVSFLAMLELVKQGILSVRQHERFSDIEMETDQVSVPKYS
ncbi:MAG: ScpA family protein [Patescibacteria group bacterium]